MGENEELKWVDDIALDLAQESYVILREVKRGIDLGRMTIFLAPRSPVPWSRVLSWEQEDQLTRYRLSVCQMLVNRGVLHSYEHVDHRGSVYGGNEWIRVVVDELLALRALRQLENRLGTRTSAVRPTSRPKRRRFSIVTAWLRDHILAGIFVTVAGGLVLTWIVRGCSGETEGVAPRELPSLRSGEVPADVDSGPWRDADEGRQASSARPRTSMSQPRAASVADRESRVGASTWIQPPYYALRFRDPRAHSFEFALLGDSIVVDALFDRGDDLTQMWPADSVSTPILRVGIHSTSLRRNPRILSEESHRGQWITFEKDRAIFVLPKRVIIPHNLRLRTEVEYGGDVRRPRVAGRWTPRSDVDAWEFRLQVQKDGTIQKVRWSNTDIVVIP